MISTTPTTDLGGGGGLLKRSLRKEGKESEALWEKEDCIFLAREREREKGSTKVGTLEGKCRGGAFATGGRKNISIKYGTRQKKMK